MTRMEHLARARVLVTGRVQGVWFRASTRETAIELGLRGWVRNLPSGQVEAVFEGPRESVEQALEWCSHGPPSARVDDRAVIWESPVGEEAFRVRYE